MKPNARLLAICPIGIGNLLLLLPALEHLKKERPDVKLTLLSLKKGLTLLAERFPCFDDIITIDAAQKQSLVSKLTLLKRLILKFDISLSFFPSNRLEYNLLPLLALVPKRIGYRYYNRGMQTASFLNSIRMPVFENRHDLIQNFTLLEALGLSLPKQVRMPEFPLNKNEKEFAENYLAACNLKGSRLIGLHPGSSAEHDMDKKRWPKEQFAALAALINQHADTRFLIFGGPEEKALKAGLAQTIGQAALVPDTRSLFETAALIARCHAFISNDSGLMHVAVACGVKTCGIFGPTADVRTAPFGVVNLVVRGPDECSPCWTIKNVGVREACRYEDFRCLQKLSAETVYRKIRPWLAD